MFRGKRVDNGKWVYGDLLHVSANNPRIIPRDMWLLTDFMDQTKRYEVDPDTVGQFTGLNDKDGKEIYEGDVVRWMGYDDEVIFELVEYGDGCFHLDDYAILNCEEIKTNNLIVVGNIHDNPELINKG